jgi:hypothetical protein
LKEHIMKILIWSISLTVSLFVAANASAEAVSGFSGGGYTYAPYSSPGVALLDSFYFQYTGDDHHITSLAAMPQSNGQIMLALADKNNDDDYFYSVEHKRRSDSGIITGSFVDFCSGSCLYPLASPGAGYVFALRGFRFYYRSDDHHIDQIGIVRESNGVRTSFNDKNDDDPYVVYVDYAWLPAWMVERTGQVTGTDDGGGVQRAVASADRAIIAGFKMDFVSDDHHLRDVGVLTRISDVQVYYEDHNSDDDFSYRVDYAVLW